MCQARWALAPAPDPVSGRAEYRVDRISIEPSARDLLPQLPGGWWAGAVICLASCWLTLTYLPYTSHHLRRKLGTWTRIFVTVCIVSTFGLLIFRRAYVFDLFLFWMVGYSLVAWNSLTAE